MGEIILIGGSGFVTVAKLIPPPNSDYLLLAKANIVNLNGVGANVACVIYPDGSNNAYDNAYTDTVRLSIVSLIAAVPWSQNYGTGFDLQCALTGLSSQTATVSYAVLTATSVGGIN